MAKKRKSGGPKSGAKKATTTPTAAGSKEHGAPLDSASTGEATNASTGNHESTKSETTKTETTKTESSKPGPVETVPKPRAQPSDASLGQQRRAAQRAERDARVRVAPGVAAAGAVEEPAFFFGFEVAWAKLVLLRVVFFLMLAWDSLEQISHAPRYGAGNFNVAQLPLLDLIAPGRELYSVGQMVSSYLFVLVACGVATKVVLPVVTALFGWLYFSSHLDSYQHHYLVWLLLVLSCFVPWQRPETVTPATPVRSWALRLILLQLAILYFWAAVSKMNSAWLDGRTLDAQLSGSMESFIQGTVGYKGAAWIVVLTELVLAATIWWRRGWLVAAPLGLLLHIGILKTGFEIGLFAWLMIALYVAVIPDVVWVWLAERQPLRAIRGGASVVSGWFHGSARFVIWVIAAGVGAVLAMQSRFDDGPAIGLGLVVILIVGTVFAVFRRRTHVAWLAIAHLLGLVMWTVVDRGTDTAIDYYRLWGGNSRRLGDPRTAEAAYRRLTEIAPDNGNGYFQLGRLLIERNDEEGVKAMRRAQDLEPLKARAYVAEAKWLSAHGQKEEAIAKAREATIVEPTDADAKTLLDSLLGTR